MKSSILFLAFVLTVISCRIPENKIPTDFDFDTPYGSNEAIGKYADVNGIKMYYEEYGEGDPMFLIHGNGGDIQSMGYQIDHFKNSYRVIVADNRGHGKSELNTDSLTYVEMTRDWAGLATSLSIDSINIIGWSDGGIIGLLLGIHYPGKINKIVTMGANLRPDTSAVYSWAVNSVNGMKQEMASKISANDTTQNWSLQKQLLGLLVDQPNISHADLSKIKAPVLIISGDKDIIREEHSIEMYQNIPNAHLCILPGQTHFAPATDPALFNQFAEKFISTPYTRPESDWTKN